MIIRYKSFLTNTILLPIQNIFGKNLIRNLSVNFRILKKNGKLIIFESYCSVVFQIATILMKHEGYDF
ncbi:hypothetical protein OAM08_03190, partial [Pelagibacteraceae bacterium]|nr:hypothetical protein [Pelagibacteraceae bacterium]